MPATASAPGTHLVHTWRRTDDILQMLGAAVIAVGAGTSLVIKRGNAWRWVTELTLFVGAILIMVDNILVVSRKPVAVQHAREQ